MPTSVSASGLGWMTDGTHLLDAGETGEFTFDGLRDQFFRFLSGERRDFGIDLNLNARDVRHSVNRKLKSRP